MAVRSFWPGFPLWSNAATSYRGQVGLEGDRHLVDEAVAGAGRRWSLASLCLLFPGRAAAVPQSSPSGLQTIRCPVSRCASFGFKS